MKKITRFHIQWHIIEACNLRCKHCYQDSFNPENMLEGAQIKKVLANLTQFLKKTNKHTTIDITGGEPLLHPDFWNICEMLEKNDSIEKFGIITNGTLLERDIVKKISSFSKLKTIKISCEGSEKEFFEYIRKFPYDKFLDILKLVSYFKGEKILMFTMMENNSNQVSGLFELVEKYGFDGFILERFFPMGKGRQLSKFILSKQTWKNTIIELLERCGFSSEDLNLVLQYKAFKIKKGEKNWQMFGAPCVVGKTGCAIMHDGSVFPCRRFALNIGNILSQSFEKIWETNPLRNIKKKDLKGLCGSCKIKNCKGCRAFAYCIYGDYLKEDPYCFLVQ
ncbi:MAG TPA: radical SAM protein [Candidatus Ratteibacteria bacterium]|uniref:Antilisterial bacteriocin subtilosin biosynthesis protein AlbA n=1 Tax=candidate division TA06 bacterium ADurb.Bin131 TaxID=1852827 RepID=A0A1V6CBH4_UNCT6|nr:MAG: Antilisterial bacteriocin subtilosin biosynthesis protein AlbA [candidate division TA06 bacterium ADurb.Bin131]HOC03392.1 radical SAM protein [bacterium]HRS05557.1 radical SAM protein [Candidatus Ratteibacteria bacterium]HON05660.1 radical SAM protein [bacterium]HOQ81571.1 radical SAM protein [bacterium]